MNISIILCTYNRSQSLSTALDSVVNPQLPAGDDWELLIVDNNSKDATREVAEKYVQKFPGHCRYVFESQQGKSHALNTGVREARGEILAFVDDDVVVDSNWLRNLTASLRDNQWCGSGGRILPERNFTPPAWLELEGRYALAPLAMFDLGTQPCELKEAPFGTNMAFRADVFSKIGNFRTDLGPQPGSEIRGEDTDFGDRVLAAGLRMWYDPSAVVYHSLPAKRLQKNYFLRWWYDKARSDLRSCGPAKTGVPSIAGVPLYAYRRLVMWTLRWLTTLNPAKRFTNRTKVWGLLGMISEFRSMSRESSPASGHTTA